MDWLGSTLLAARRANDPWRAVVEASSAMPPGNGAELVRVVDLMERIAQCRPCLNTLLVLANQLWARGNAEAALLVLATFPDVSGVTVTHPFPTDDGEACPTCHRALRRARYFVLPCGHAVHGVCAPGFGSACVVCHRAPGGSSPTLRCCCCWSAVFVHTTNAPWRRGMSFLCARCKRTSGTQKRSDPCTFHGPLVNGIA